MFDSLKFTKPEMTLALATLFLPVACNNDPGSQSGDSSEFEGQACVTNDDCQKNSLVCFQETCHKICTGDENCRPAQICSDNVCLDVLNPECTTDTDCQNKFISSCFSPLNPTCSGAKCHYRPMTSETNCDDGNACTTDDKCDGNGACVGVPLLCKKESICDGNNYITYKGSCNELNDKGCVFTANTPVPSNNCEVEYLGRKDRGADCNDSAECAGNMLCVEHVCCSGAEELQEADCVNGVYSFYSCTAGTKGNYEKIERTCNEGCKADHSACNGECSSHDDCRAGFYCDLAVSGKCIPQEENGFKVGVSQDTRVCKSQVISVDGYCCDTACDTPSTLRCLNECAAETTSYSCRSGSCLPEVMPQKMDNDKICFSNKIVDLSNIHNCGYFVKNDSECLSKTYYRACDAVSGTCRQGEDTADAVVTVRKAPKNYYYAETNSIMTSSGYYYSVCGGQYELIQSTCDGNGAVKIDKNGCPHGCDPAKKACK